MKVNPNSYLSVTLKGAIVLLTMLITMSSCNQDDTQLTKTPGKIQFTLGASVPNSSGGRLTSDLIPVDVMIEYSTVIGSDTSEVQSKTIPIFEFGTGYISEFIELPVGNYILSKFLVRGEQNKIIYATPLKNSEMAKYVKNPLPVAFNVGSNVSRIVDLEVLPVTEEQSPSRFGYTAFSFNVVQPNVRIVKLKGTVYVIEDVDSVLKGRVKVGDIVIGEIRYEMTPTAAGVVTPNVSSYYTFTSSSNLMEFNVNGYSFKTSPINPILNLYVYNNWAQPNVIDYISYDSYTSISPFSQAEDVRTFMSFSLTDANHSALSNTDIPFSFNPNNWNPKNFMVGGIKPNGKWAYAIVCSITEMP
jgi:hypothetical protein